MKYQARLIKSTTFALLKKKERFADLWQTSQFRLSGNEPNTSQNPIPNFWGNISFDEYGSARTMSGLSKLKLESCLFTAPFAIL